MSARCREGWIGSRSGSPRSSIYRRRLFPFCRVLFCESSRYNDQPDRVTILLMSLSVRVTWAVLFGILCMSSCSRDARRGDPVPAPPVIAAASRDREDVDIVSQPRDTSSPDASTPGVRESDTEPDEAPASEHPRPTETTLVGTLRYRVQRNAFGEVMFRGFMLVTDSETYVIDLARSEHRGYRAWDGRRVRVTGTAVSGNPMAQFDPPSIRIPRIELVERAGRDGG